MDTATIADPETLKGKVLHGMGTNTTTLVLAAAGCTNRHTGGTLNTWCSGYGVELKNVPIPKVTCSIPVQTECKTSGSFSETAGECQSKDLHSLASALCGNSSNR